ncbi:hypothetical protein LP7551_05126 [Roseibium album]|nr:hypothetical protein LP7551_05126 [Roseibium album]
MTAITHEVDSSRRVVTGVASRSYETSKRAIEQGEKSTFGWLSKFLNYAVRMQALDTRPYKGIL